MRCGCHSCSRVSVRRVNRALQTLECRASHREAATGIVGSCSHGSVGRLALLVRPAIGGSLQGKERTR
jgi:hypothetical protein